MVMVSPFARAEIAGLKRRSENGAAAMWPPRTRNAAQKAMRKGLNAPHGLRDWQKLPGTKRCPWHDGRVTKRLARPR
jgi:hypothetical protein